MPGNIDKTRSERTGLLTFTGSGVDTIPDVMEENIDLRQQMQDMINEALANVTGATILQDVPDQITYNFSGGGVDMNALQGLIESMIWDVISPDLDMIYLMLQNIQARTVARDNFIQNQINNLESGGGGKWFVLTAASSDPMTGTIQTGDSNEAGVSIYIHPDSHIDNYAAADHVFGAKIGEKWYSVNFFSVPLTFVGRQLELCS